MKYMDIKYFRQLGFLQEVNRQFFHPLGLALEVVVDDETGEERLGGIQDYRDDPVGVVFPEGTIEVEKFEYMKNAWADMNLTRRKELGWMVQPLEENNG